jgi:hypothetical protein
MSSHMSVDLGVSDRRVAAWHRAALATLPLTLIEAGAAASLALIDGRCREWPGLAVRRLRLGARGLLIHRPTADTSPHGISWLADELESRGVPAVLAGRWCSPPHIAELAAQIDACGAPDVVDSFVQVADMREIQDSLVEQVFIVQSLVGDIARLELAGGGSGYTVIARPGAAVVTLCSALVAATPPQLTVAAYDQRSSCRLRLVGDGSARAAELSVTDASGSRILPARYETGDRSCWRRLAEEIAGHQTAGELRRYGQAVALASSYNDPRKESHE